VKGEVEIDGAYFGGYIKPANYKKDRVDRRLAENQNGKRWCVVIIRERNCVSLPFVFKSEDAAIPTIRERVALGNTLHRTQIVRRIGKGAGVRWVLREELQCGRIFWWLW
jgi:hypothetical protein